MRLLKFFYNFTNMVRELANQLKRRKSKSKRSSDTDQAQFKNSQSEAKNFSPSMQTKLVNDPLDTTPRNSDSSSIISEYSGIEFQSQRIDAESKFTPDPITEERSVFCPVTPQNNVEENADLDAPITPQELPDYEKVDISETPFEKGNVFEKVEKPPQKKSFTDYLRLIDSGLVPCNGSDDKIDISETANAEIIVEITPTPLEIVQTVEAMAEPNNSETIENIETIDTTPPSLEIVQPEEATTGPTDSETIDNLRSEGETNEHSDFVIDVNKKSSGSEKDSGNMDRDDQFHFSEKTFEDSTLRFSKIPEEKRIINKSIPQIKIRTQTENAEAYSDIDPYFKKYILHRQFSKIPEADEITTFIEALEKNNVDHYLTLPPLDLEKYLFGALLRVTLIGELPISEDIFTRMNHYIRVHGYQKGSSPQKKIPPSIFMVSMVFCARYSKDGLRNFWDPYAKLVWKEDEATQYFQIKCREHFKNCRIDLERSAGLKFDYINEGGVVRPVFQHAIIPFYLQDDIADWIIRNYDFLIGHSAQEIKYLLNGSSSLDYMPRRLKAFISGTDTADTAAELLNKMGDALKIYIDTGEEEDVIAYLNSSIELSLWQMIYIGLMSTLMAGSRTKRSVPKIVWTWNLNTDELGLRVSGLKSSPEQKPDSLIWLTNPHAELLHNKLVQVFPWGNKNDGWEVDPEILIPEDTLTGSVLLLSDECNLNNTSDREAENIITGLDIPDLTDDLLIFKRMGKTDLAYHKDKINCDGDWLIISRDPISIKAPTGAPIISAEKYIPSTLATIGYAHASVYSLNLPLLINGQLVEAVETEELETTLIGTPKFSNLSDTVPPIYSTNGISLILNKVFEPERMGKINLTIYHKNKTVDPFTLQDLQSKNILQIKNGRSVVDLQNWLKEPGVYVINLLQNLKPLLSEPIEFAWLPERIKITEPEQNKIYSPVDKFVQRFYGIKTTEIQGSNENILNLNKTNDFIELTWGKLSHPQCRFRILFQGESIQLSWNIDRVDAWLEGADDPNAVVPDQLDRLSVHYVGSRNSYVSVGLKGSKEKWNFKLPASGELTEKVGKSQLGVILQVAKGSPLDVVAQMRGFEWKVFSVISENKISIETARYSNGQLFIELTGKLPAQANFTVYVKQFGVGALNQVEDLKTLWIGEKRFSHSLSPGKYTIEINKDHKAFLSSQPFQVEKILSSDDLSLLFADEQRLLRASTSNDLIQMVQKQFEQIHDPSFWTVNENNYDGIVNLLPAWAVISNHIRLQSEYYKIIQVVPERVAFKGKAGIGYADIKTDGKWIRVAVYWRPDKYTGDLLAWMGIPEQKPNVYSETDPFDLWPVYQCKDCGTFVGSKSGTLFKLPPSVHVIHDHGRGRPIKQQFVDTVYEEPVKVKAAPYLENSIEYSYTPDKVINKAFLNGLVLGTSGPKEGELSVPINFYESDDFTHAVSELFQNSTTNAVIQLQQMSRDLTACLAMIKLNNQKFAPFTAFHRLIRPIDENKSELKIVAVVVALGMIARLRKHNLNIYQYISTNTGLTDKKIIDYINLCSTTCPKLLTWGITWAELFLNHTAS